MLRIAIAGGGRLGINLLEPLLKSRHKIVAVVQDGRRVRGINRTLQPWLSRFIRDPHSVPGRAKRLGLPIIWIDKMTENELAPLRKLDVDLLLVGGFGIILKKTILELPRLGCVNCHSSLLPRHRGPNPFSTVLLSDDEETGVTFHIMEPGIDTGPIIDQAAFPISKTHTMFTIYKQCCELAGTRVTDVIDRADRDGLRGTPQDITQATYDKKPTAADAWIDWNQPAWRIDRKVRGLGPSPAPRFRFQGRTVFLFRAQADPKLVDANPGTVLSNRGAVKVATGEGSITLQAAFTGLPAPWVWPAPWCRPEIGEQLE